VKNAKAGQVRFRTDKNGIIHAGIGKIDFSADAIQGNIDALVAEVKKLKPSTSKGIYLKKITLSSTMGPGLTVDHAKYA
jgi:large subunit ribosomal protein L1